MIELCTGFLIRLKVVKKDKVELILNFGNCTETLGVTSFKNAVLKIFCEVVCDKQEKHGICGINLTVTLQIILLYFLIKLM